MNVLLADDSSTIRSILKRFLAKEYGCSVIEAGNGLEALKTLDQERISLVLMDVHMPVMDGLEALEILRGSVYSALPVVMLTSDRDQELFTRAVALGITDYLTKPLKPDTMEERLGKIMGSLDTKPSGPDRDDTGGPAIESDATVLIAEGDPDHRHFLQDYFSTRCQVTQASTGVEALQTCMSEQPQMVFVGGDLGIVDAPMLARKIRGIGALAETRVVASVPRSQVSGARADGVYDAVIARSFVLEVFKDQVERLTQQHDPSHTPFERVHPQVREGLRSAIEQVFGMVLASEVEVLDSEMVPEGTDEMVATCIELPVPQQSLTLGFELLVRKDEAAGLAARMTGEAADDVTETDRDSAVAEIVNMVVGRLQNTLDERGVTSRIGLPTTEVRAARRPTAEPSDCTAIHFRCADGKPELWLHVVATADASGSQAGEDKAA